MLQCDEFLPGSQLSDGVYRFKRQSLHQNFRAYQCRRESSFALRKADRDHLGEAIIKAQESQSGRGLELKACIKGKASGFLLFNDLEEAKRKITNFRKDRSSSKRLFSRTLL